MGRNSQPATEGQELRRSARAWRPSEKALHRIAADEKKVAALLEECLADEHDSVFLVSEAAAKDPFFQTDLAFSTQDRDIPRSYAQILHLPGEERDRWLQACQRECRSHLSIPSISRPLQPSEWTKAPPIRLTWVFAKKDVYKTRYARPTDGGGYSLQRYACPGPVRNLCAYNLGHYLSLEAGSHSVGRQDDLSNCPD